MKRFHKLLSIAFALTLGAGNHVVAQNFPVEDRQLYDFFKSIPVDYSLAPKKASGSAKSPSAKGQRPDHVNNQATNYFPPIFNQVGGSCGSSSNVAYMLCYEINSLHNTDGKHDPNYQFPTHFSWLACTDVLPESSITINNGVPSVATYGGTTYSRYFGMQDASEKDWGWMQGYDKWYSAMFNRAQGMGKFPYSMSTPEGIESAKNWLWNHNGDDDFQTGGVFVIGVAAGPAYTSFPNTAANQEAGVVGHHYVTSWGPTFNHALTVVGYDDRVEFDLDGNGVVGEKDKGEVGAWIIVNSWGDGWCDQGMIYCPYAYTYCVGTSGSAWDPAVYYPRKNYRPLRTIKVLMDYSRRYEICLCGGVAQDTTATKPEYTTAFTSFNYSGATKTGTADVPMLGRWADGYHYEPMELGYDLTDLTANIDRTKPAKYFFYITTKFAAKGNGNIYKASIIDYEFERNGVEIPFDIDTVAIQNKGNTTMITVIVPGEQVYKPLNLQLTDQTLTWQRPQKSNLPLKGYAIYNNKKKIAQVDANTLSYALTDKAVGPYTVTAIYDYQGQDNESAYSNIVYNVSTSIATKTNTALELRNSMITLPNAVPAQSKEATIEFWIKPYSLTSYNQQIGHSWGTFLFHTDYSGGITVGWNTNDRIQLNTGGLKVNTWTHIAIAINGGAMTLYVNGMKKGSLTSTDYSGLPAISNFKIGDDYYKFNGLIDEFRVWNSCRTQKEIYTNMRRQIAHPELQPNLVTYYNMDATTNDGTTSLLEYVGLRNADITNIANCKLVEDEAFLKGASSTFSVDFGLSADSICVGEDVTVSPSIPLNATKVEWKAEGSATPNTTMNAPSFTYSKVGKYTIELTVTNANGDPVKATHDIVVKTPAMPIADFTIAVDSLPAGDRFSFINRSKGQNCSYKWTMEGADVETLSSTNASATFIESGRHAITLSVTNEAGTSTCTKYVMVKNTTPAVDFSVTPSAIILGEKISLTDQTRYSPTKWMWTISNERHNVGINGQNYAYTPKAPGVYDVTLTATNEVGTGTKTIKRAFMVSNADPQNGLNFAGNGEQVSFNSPVSSSLKAFTIDYWLFPYKVDGAANISSEDGVFKMSTNANGETSVVLNGKTVNSGEGFVIPNEWHHYALTCKAGTVTFYRDGEKFAQPSARLSISSPAWTGLVTIGDTDTPFSGMIDEFKFWNKSLTIDELQATCNAPIANVDSMKANGGLMVYYNFNQSTGNVKCLTDDQYTGKRQGFGPDGDAWASSLGVFTLDFSAKVAPKDVSADYLTNYKAPFFHTATSVNSTNYVSRFYELQTDESYSKWIVENTVTDPSTNVTTGVHVDTYFNSDLSCTTGNEGFATSINDQRAYQTITLPAGRYKLSVTPNASHFASTGSYIAVNQGDTLVGNQGLNNAIAYTALDDKELTFDILEDGTIVSLGLIFNMEKNNSVAIEALSLTQYPFEFINADDPSAVEDITNTDVATTFAVENGGIRCTQAGKLTIVNLQGIKIFSAHANRGLFISLPAGIYIANGTKVEVK